MNFLKAKPTDPQPKPTPDGPVPGGPETAINMTALQVSLAVCIFNLELATRYPYTLNAGAPAQLLRRRIADARTSNLAAHRRH